MEKANTKATIFPVEDSCKINTFNDFQYYSYLYHIYQYMLDEPEKTKEIIRTLFIPTKGELGLKYNFSNYLGMAVITGEMISFVLGIITKNYIPLYGFILGGFPIYKLTDSVLNKKYQKEVFENIDDIYNSLITQICEELANTCDYIPTDNDIHTMSESLLNGEKEHKYDYLDSFGKCPIFMFEGYSYGSFTSWIMQIPDPNLSRAYEVAMHISTMMYEGYEDDLRSMFIDIKNYAGIIIDKNSDKKQKEEAIEKLNKYESRCANMARSLGR